ncbi:MAG: class I SAM-dependent methyltransferase [Pseudomonadota bacterium]
MAFENGIPGLQDLIAAIQTDPSKFEDISRDLKGQISGMSGLRFRLLISEAAARMNAGLAYLEIGIYQAYSPLTVAQRAPGIRVVGVDNFSQVDLDGSNLSKIYEAIDLNGAQNFEVFDEDFEKFLVEDPAGVKGQVGIYYFDASHDYRSQMLALVHAPNWLADGGLIAVDDCNYPHVRQATADFLTTHCDFKLLCEFYTGSHPQYWKLGEPKSQRGLVERLRSKKTSREPDLEHEKRCRESWWNGVNILVHDPKDTLEPMLPSLPKDLRDGFLSQHGFAGCDAAGTVDRVAHMRG